MNQVMSKVQVIGCDVYIPKSITPVHEIQKTRNSRQRRIVTSWTIAWLSVLLQLALMIEGAVLVRAEAEVPLNTYKIAEDTAVYRLPREDSEQLALIHAGWRVQILAQSDEWAKVKSQHGRPSGYIKTSNLVDPRPLVTTDPDNEISSEDEAASNDQPLSETDAPLDSSESASVDFQN